MIGGLATQTYWCGNRCASDGGRPRPILAGGRCRVLFRQERGCGKIPLTSAAPFLAVAEPALLLLRLRSGLLVERLGMQMRLTPLEETWAYSLPLQGRKWNEALGRTRCDLRQSHQHWSGNNQTISLVISLSTHIRFFLNDPADGAWRGRFFCATMPATSIGIAIRKDISFAPESN
jgi:hypothetical protein